MGYKACKPLTDKEIDQKHDVFFRIEEAAKILKEGEYYTDADFRDVVCKLNANEFRRPSLDSTFDKYKGKAGGITYWSHPKSIAIRKERGVFK